MKPLVIYHANCADGFGAAFAAWLKLGDNAKYWPMQYGDVPKFPKGTADSDFNVTFWLDRDIYILDFSLPKHAMDWLFTHAKRVVLLDHHKTAFEMAGSAGWPLGEAGKHHITLDNTKSGAYLAWEFFHPDIEVPMLIKHIDDYDRWVFAIDGTKEFNKFLWSRAPWAFPEWEQIKDALEGAVGQGVMYSSGAAILRAHDQNVQSVVKGAARKCQIICPVSPIMYVDLNPAPWVYDQDPKFAKGSAVGLAANCPPHLASDVGHELANQSGTFGLLWHIDKDGKCKCSLRSNGNYDVSAIAKAFGGGGHRNAAGFEVDIQTLLGWIR